MSGRLLAKYSSGLASRTFQLTSTRAPAAVGVGVPILLGAFSSNCSNQSQRFSSLFASAVRNFSRSCSSYDKAAVSISDQQHEEVFTSQEQNAKPVTSTGRDDSPDEARLAAQEYEEQQSQDDKNANLIRSEFESNQLDVGVDSVHSTSTAALPPSQKREVSHVSQKSSINEKSGGIIDRLRKLSMTDMSRYSELDTDEEPLKNSKIQFDPKILKMVNANNRLKSRGGGGGYGQYDYNYNSYDRPNNYKKRDIYDDADDEDSPRQAQRYSGGGSSFRSNAQNQRRQPRMEYREDNYDDEDDIDFDVSRKRRGTDSDSTRLAEQAQLRRGGGRSLADDDDDEYEDIVRNRFANRRENSRATRSNEYD